MRNSNLFSHFRNANYPLILLLIVAFFLRIYKLETHGLAGDEKYSLFVSQFIVYDGGNTNNVIRSNTYFTPKEFWDDVEPHDFLESIARLDTGNGALYTFSLHFWSIAFGNSDFSLRFLSLIFNLATIILLYSFVVVHFKNKQLANWVALLSTISPFFIVFSQVARCYSMLIFFTLLSTHLLLLVLKKQHEGESTKKELIFYGSSVLLAMLCHVSVFVLYISHGIYLLIYHRNPKTLLKFSFAMLIPLFGFTAWLMSYGGRFMFEYVANSTAAYNYMALNSPEEYLKVATFKNIIWQIQHVISSFFISTEGIYKHILGFKNIVIAALSATTLLIIEKNKLRRVHKMYLSLVIIFISVSLFSVEKIHFLVLIGNLYVLFYFVINFIQFRIVHTQNKLTIFIVLIISIAFISLILFSLRDGNTFRIMPRYIGYAYPYGIVLFALVINHFFNKDIKEKFWLLAIGTIQFYFLIVLISDIYKDKQPRYFMEFAEARQRNPYQIVAKNIISKATASDTLLLPSYAPDVYGGKDLPEYSIVDAQLITIYLPKNSSLTQKINRNEPNKVILKHSDGSSELLFDFEGNKYRY